MLHTVGLAMIVGPAWVLDVRLLGYGVKLPVEALRGAFRIMWLLHHQCLDRHRAVHIRSGRTRG